MATDSGNSNGEFCKVLGAIHPVDPTAPDIKFEVNLPTNWNNRMLQMGGGGYDGSLVTGVGGSSNQLPSAPTPLAQGYVTLGSDSGHEGTGFDGAFALFKSGKAGMELFSGVVDTSRLPASVSVPAGLPTEKVSPGGILLG